MPSGIYNRNKPTIRNCKTCKKTFVIPYVTNNRQYCSHVCWWKHYYAKAKKEFRIKQTVFTRHKKGMCAKCGMAKTDKWFCQGCKAIERHRSKYYQRKMKIELITAYGGKCQCCDEQNIEFLTIDHIKGNGRKHSIKVCGASGGHIFYRWLKKQGYPKDNFRLLCFNCNCARGFAGYCPHELLKVR